MTPVLDHQYFESGPSHGAESSDLMIPQSSFYDFPLFSQLPQDDNDLAFEPRNHIPQPLDLSRAGVSRFGSIEEDWASQESSTPYDHSFYTGTEAGWMQGAYSPNPRLRVQQSAPNSASSPATPPPMNAGGNWAPIDWSNIPSEAYLSPTAQNFSSPQQAFRGHKRLSSGSSVASAEPNSPYTQSSIYPQIVDADNLSASSPHIEAYDTGLQQASSYEKPLYYQHPSPLNSVSFVQPFENLNLSNENPYEMMARRNQNLQERHAATSGQVNTDQTNMNRSFPRSDTVSGGGNMMTNALKLNRTDSDVYADELYVQQAPPQAQAQGHADQSAHASSNSAVNNRLKQAQATRAQQQQQASRSLTPSTDMSRDSPLSDFAPYGNSFQMTGNYRATAQAGTSQQQQRQQQQSQQPRLSSSLSSSQQQQQQQQQDLTKRQLAHGSDDGGAGIINQNSVTLIKPEDLDSTRPTATQGTGVAKNSNTRTPKRNEPSGFAAEPPFVNHLQSSVTGITDGNSGHNNTLQAHYAATTPARNRNLNNLGPANFYPHPQHQLQHPTTTNLLSHVDPLNMASSNAASAGAAAYPFIAGRRQSTSTRSEQTEPTFPASLPSMESTKSESSREPNVRPPAFTRQDTSASTQRSEAPSPRTARPSDTSANAGTYTCTAPGCNARFSDGKKLSDHRKVHDPPGAGSAASRAAHSSASRTSGSAASPRTSSTSSSSTRVNNPQAEINNQSRNSAPGPHRCQRNNPQTGLTCGAVFSRSYDLVRHEDTIHSSNRPRIRCEHCPEEKTFSRSDALTRHMRVVHPDITDTTTTRNRRRG